jgi:hypothetical protein
MSKTRFIVALALGALILAAVLLARGRRDGQVKASAAPPTPATADSAPGSTSGDTFLTGTVWVQGAVPVMDDIAERRGDPVCAKTPRKHDDVVVDARGALKDALVRLAPGSVKGRWPEPPGDVLLDQRECMYVPHVFGILTGSRVVVRNGDKTMHNIHTYRGSLTQFNRGQPPASSDVWLPERGSFDEEGLITFRCDIHKWMTAYGVVTDHPYFTVTGDDGLFKLEGFEPGRYPLEVWHPVLGSKVKTVDVTEGKPLAVDIAYDANVDRRPQR